MGLEKNRVVDPVLTNIARGYVNAAFIGTRLMPVVRIEKEAGKIPQWGKESFKIYNTLRAIRANSNRIVPEARSSIPFDMDEHDLEYPVDYREYQEDVFNLRDHARRVAQDGVLLKQEKMIADVVTNATSYEDTNKEQLTGNDQLNTTTSDPESVIGDAKEACRNRIAVEPNTLVLGANVFKVLKRHAKLKELIKYSMKGIVTADLMKEIFDADQLLVGKAVYSSDDGVFGPVWDNIIIWAYVARNETPNQYEPSFGYTLAKRNAALVDSYTENGGKIEVMRYTDIFDAKIVGSEAGYLVYDCIGEESEEEGGEEEVGGESE